MGKMFSATIKVDKPEDKPGDAETEGTEGIQAVYG